MNDMLNQEIRIGDIVAYTANEKPVMLGTVTGFKTTKNIEILPLGKEDNKWNRLGKQHDKVIRVTEQAQHAKDNYPEFYI